MTAEALATRHPFLDGKPKRMFIDGRWVEAASGKTFETVNPSTGEVLARVAEGEASVAAGPGAEREPAPGDVIGVAELGALVAGGVQSGDGRSALSRLLASSWPPRG